MEVREPSGRYLVTQPGCVLTGWENFKLGAIASFRTGPFGSALHKSDYVLGGVPVVNPMQIEDGRIKPTERMSVAVQAAERLGEFRLKVGDVVIGRRGEMGRCAFVQGEQEGWLCGTGSMIVRPGVLLDGRFLQRVLSGKQVVRAIESASVGTTMVNLNQRTLAELDLHMPVSVDEQTSIAGALGDADALIDSLEQLLTKKRQIKEGAMQELLTAKRRLPGFEAAWIDGVLDDVVAELVAGVSVNSDPTESGAVVPSVVKTSALKNGIFDPTECKPIIQADLARATTPLRQDTLLISRMNTPDLVGEVGYVDRAYDWLYLPDRIWMTRVRSPDCVCVRWLGYLLSSAPYKRLISDTATGTSGSMKNIAKSGLLGLRLRFPEVAEQRAIADRLADMDAEITALESRLTKARALKQAMAQALLTGRIRLVEPTP